MSMPPPPTNPEFQPPSYQPPSYQPYGVPPVTQGTSGLAIASLVCSLVGFLLCGVPAILGIIFGGVALSQTKNNARPGQGLALAGVIVGVVVVLFWGIALYDLVTNPDGWFSFNDG